MRIHAELSSEVTKLKEVQSSKEAEWKTTKEKHRETLQVLRAQIGEANRQKEAAEERAHQSRRKGDCPYGAVS